MSASFFPSRWNLPGRASDVHFTIVTLKIHYIPAKSLCGVLLAMYAWNKEHSVFCRPMSRPINFCRRYFHQKFNKKTACNKIRISLLRRFYHRRSDLSFLLRSLWSLWLHGNIQYILPLTGRFHVKPYWYFLNLRMLSPAILVVLLVI